MNNSEVSVKASATNVFAEPQAYIYPSSWEGLTENLSHTDGPFDSRYSVGGVVGSRCLEATDDVPSTFPIEEPLRQTSAEPTDFGFWLLSNSTRRHAEWERLRREQHINYVPNVGLNHSSGFAKRYCDVLGSVILLVLLAPLFLLIAILIKLDSPGSVFFRHYRVGKDGNHFVLWKFRSMRMNVPKYEVSPQSVVDTRLTRVGRVIRRMSIDEIPQLINVLKGEMSLVGPRPEMPFIVDRYHPAECERLSARPGITGLWQISPARAFPIHENLQYDLHYIRNQNFFLDCVIIMRTITAVIHGVGAV
jgi:lipopolysaccharide/colanic/teichoic acid biosynthesis glycosyltransferase